MAHGRNGCGGHNPRDGKAHSRGPGECCRCHRRPRRDSGSTRPRTSSPRAKTRSMCLEIRGGSSRSTDPVWSLHLPRGLALIPRRSMGGGPGPKIVFHPQHTGSDQSGIRLTEWGAASSPYYEKAMIMRSIENTIYFASVNYGRALPGIGNESRSPRQPVPGVLALWGGRRPGAGHQHRGSHRLARHSIRPGAIENSRWGRPGDFLLPTARVHRYYLFRSRRAAWISSSSLERNRDRSA